MMKRIGALILHYLAFLFTTHAQDAYLQDLSLGGFIRSRADEKISVAIRNTTDLPITSFRLAWRWKNGPIHRSPDQQLPGSGLTSGLSYPFTHPAPLRATEDGPGKLEVWVEVQGDRNGSNDTLAVDLFALSRYFPRTVLLEMKTSAGCHFCPKGNIVANALDADPQVAIAKFHVDDQFSDPLVSKYFDRYTTDPATPMAVIDQGEAGSYPANTQASQWTKQVQLRKPRISPVKLDVRAKFNKVTRELCIETGTHFAQTVPGDHILNAFVIEDGIQGNQAGADGSYMHGQVVRKMLGGISGTAGVIPGEPDPEKEYAFTYGTIIPDQWNADALRVIVVVSSKNGRYHQVLNAAKAPVRSAQ